MFIVNTIHDSIIVEMPEGEQDVFTSLSKQCFTEDCFDYLRDVYNIDFISPLGVTTHIGSYWGDGKEEQFNLDPKVLQ